MRAQPFEQIVQILCASRACRRSLLSSIDPVSADRTRSRGKLEQNDQAVVAKYLRPCSSREQRPKSAPRPPGRLRLPAAIRLHRHLPFARAFRARNPQDRLRRLRQSRRPERQLADKTASPRSLSRAQAAGNANATPAASGTNGRVFFFQPPR